MLTATPFQLHHAEAIRVLNVIDHMTPAIGTERVDALQKLRGRMAQCMENSEHAGRAFSHEWGTLADQLAKWDPNLDLASLVHHPEADPRPDRLADIWKRLVNASEPGSDSKIDEVPGPIRPFFKRAVELREANQSLKQAMGQLVIRHRRSNEHRRYWVGREYPPRLPVTLRPDQNRLHLAAGQSLEPKDELVQYLLMKVVSELNRGRRRTSLGSSLTGCYTTLWESREGRAAIDAAVHGGNPGLMKLLQRLTGKANGAKDGEHPKLKRVAQSVLDLWDRGEKSLIFCFRVPTARALYEELSQRITARLRRKRVALLRTRGTEIAGEADEDKAMQQFRRALTARDSSGVPLFLDRVLAGWFARLGWPPPSLSENDIAVIANLACGKCRAARSPAVRGL